MLTRAFSASSCFSNSTYPNPRGKSTFLSHANSILLTVPNVPKISSKCALLTLRVSLSTWSVVGCGVGLLLRAGEDLRLSCERERLRPLRAGDLETDRDLELRELELADLDLLLLELEERECDLDLEGDLFFAGDFDPLFFTGDRDLEELDLLTRCVRGGAL